MAETVPLSNVSEVSRTFVVFPEAVTEDAITYSPLPSVPPPRLGSLSVHAVSASPVIAVAKNPVKKLFFFILLLPLILI